MKEPQILFKGMTRPAMIFGVPIKPFVTVVAFVGMFTFYIALWTNNVFYIALIIPIVVIMRFVATFDDFMYSLLYQSSRAITPNANKKYYGVKTYTSTQYRQMSNKVEPPILSILGLDRNPSFEKYIPYSAVVKDGIVITKESQLMSTWEIKGIAFEVESNQEQDYMNKILANIFIAFSNEPVAFYFHSARHDVDTHLKAKYDNKYLQEINDLYYKSFTKGNSKATNLYLTMIYNPFMNSVDRNKFKNLSYEKYKNEFLVYMNKFEDYSNRLEANLSGFNAKKLKAYWEDDKKFSNQLEFFNYLIGGKFIKTRALNTPLNEYLIGGLQNIQFSGDLVQLNYTTGDKKFAQAIEIKDYSSYTFSGMLDVLMYLDVNYTMTQSFSPLQRNEAKEDLKKQQNHFKASEDDSFTQAKDFVIALNELTNGEICFGKYHFSLVVFGDDVKSVKDNTNKVITNLQDIGLQVTLADMALPHTYFSQFPTNYATRPRVSPITNRNYASLIALHNFPKGREKNNPWGDAITVLKTPSRQPYYLNLHEEKGKNDFGDFTLANFLVLGQSGGGKTVFQQFLCNQLLKFNDKDTFPKNIPEHLKKMTLVYFDKDYGAMGNILSAGGRYITLKNGINTGFNPFMIEPNIKVMEIDQNLEENSKEYLEEKARYDKQKAEYDTQMNHHKRNIEILMKILVTANGEPLKTSEEKQLTFAINSIMNHIPLKERKYGISLLLEHLTDDNTDENSLKQRFSLWKRGAKYGWVFDNENDLLDFPENINFFGIDGTEFLDDPDVSSCISFYLLYRTTNLIDGRRFALIIDEFWQWLANDLVQDEIFNKLKTIRKENGLIGMASQSVEDVLKLKTGKAIIEQTSTKFFFPNKQANYDDYKALSCTPEEFNIIKDFNPSQFPFLVKRMNESVITNLDLSKLGKENISIISTNTAYTDKLNEIFAQEKSLDQKVQELKNYYKNK